MTDIKEQELKAILEIDLSVVEPQLREKSREIKASFSQLGKKEFGGSKQNIDYLQKSIEFICIRHQYKHPEQIKKNIEQFIQKLTEVKANTNVIPDLKNIESQANELIDLHNKYVDLCVMAKRWKAIPDVDKDNSRGYFEFKNQLGVILGFIPLEALLNVEGYYKNKYQGGAECE